MSTTEFLLHDWNYNPAVLTAGALALGIYFYYCGLRARWGFFVTGVIISVLTLISPLDTLADGQLFSAHMAQHLLLLLIAPSFLLLGLPPSFRLLKQPHPLACWLCGVLPMYLWHVPRFCDAATRLAPVHVFQIVSLLALGAVFWWPILAPNAQNRLMPLAGVGYLFAACLGCTALGVVLTLTPVEVCSIYRAPVDRYGILNTMRDDWSMTPERDREIGGLIMWVPMCLIYLSAIVIELARWLGGDERSAHPEAQEVRL